MEIKRLIEQLHPLERKVVPILVKSKEFSSIVKSSGLKDVEVMRALQWLENKNVLKIKQEVKEIVELDVNGKAYTKKGLPEKRFLQAIKDGKKHSHDSISKSAKLSKQEIGACIGLLKKKMAIFISKKGKDMMFKITVSGKKILEKDSLEEQFLKKLGSRTVELSSLKPEERFAFCALKTRKNIIKTKVVKPRSIELSALGKKLTKEKIKTGVVIDRLTPELIKTGNWKSKKFRAYDVKINVPEVYGGKRHFVRQAMKYARQVWLEMGFKEMTGSLINTSFWNFDALFTAQDHPVRDLQDTYFIKDPKYGKLPNKKLVNAVKGAHENGKGCDSLGWQYQWKQEEAKKNVLRTHTTVLSSKTIAQLKKSDLPAKFFATGRCFRNEAIDWAHLFEFNQVEGIVIDPDANLRHLLGYLKEFFKKMGFPKARFRPAHFPYTEPSVEIEAFHPVHKIWIELGGAGVFRPELVIPLLGKDIPVLAWGPGFDRIILEYYKINDIRELYKNDLKQLSEIKIWNK